MFLLNCSSITDTMEKLKILPPPVPNRNTYPFTGVIKYKGLTIDVENLDGSVREGVGPGGKKWKTPFKGAHYGEIRGSKGSDGDLLDVYIKDPPDNTDKVFVVHQNFPGNHPSKAGQYDEDKVILGVKNAESAKALYLRHYDRKDFLRSITEMPFSKFKRYAFGENKGEKVANEITGERAREVGEQIGIDWNNAEFPVEQLRRGIVVEREHGSELGKNTDVGADNDLTAARIAWAHLKELPDYYTRLDKMEEAGKKGRGKKTNGDDVEDKPGKSLRREPSAFIRTRMKEGSVYEDVYNFGVKLALRQLGLDKEAKGDECETPGEKIRSKGQGRGMAQGKGKGPIGIPIGEKLKAFAKKNKKKN